MFLEQLSLSGSPVTYSPPEQTRPICPNNPVCVMAQGRCYTVGLEPAQVFSSTERDQRNIPFSVG